MRVICKGGLYARQYGMRSLEVVGAPASVHAANAVFCEPNESNARRFSCFTVVNSTSSCVQRLLRAELWPSLSLCTAVLYIRVFFAGVAAASHFSGENVSHICAKWSNYVSLNMQGRMLLWCIPTRICVVFHVFVRCASLWYSLMSPPMMYSRTYHFDQLTHALYAECLGQLIFSFK